MIAAHPGTGSLLAQPPIYERLPDGFRVALPDSRRADPGQLEREVGIATRSAIVTALLASVDSVLLVLNAERQIVALSSGAANLAAVQDLRGRRPGEALGCVNAQSPAGCGASPACQTCGSLGAILAARRDQRPTEAECLLRSVAGGGTAFEFTVRAAPITMEDAQFTVVSLRDISAEKRRQALEQVFFHDVLNTVMGLRGWTTRLRGPSCDLQRAVERLDVLGGQLEREIRDHRDLVEAEKGTLAVTPEPVACLELLRELEGLFASHPAARDRRLVVELAPADLELQTDRSLLRRVLVNMVRNAFEAIAPGGAVHLRAAVESGGRGATGPWVRFSVHNQGEIPADVQHRIFVRSFSTKGGRGRGLGTYSMKLLGERHLGGEVSFTSSAEAGTTFSFRLPRGAPRADTRSPAAKMQ
jgi:signal transduction histidine kinase